MKPQYERKTAQCIVNEVNEARGTSINEKTVRQYVAEGNTVVPYLCVGRKTIMPECVVRGIQSTMVSYVQLLNKGMKKMSNCKDMINVLKRCISKSTYQFKRFDKFL